MERSTEAKQMLIYTFNIDDHLCKSVLNRNFWTSLFAEIHIAS